MKKKTAVILLIIVIIAAAVGFFVYKLWNREDKTEVQTSYGDVFTITFDDYLVKSLVQDRDTGWYYTFSSKLTTEDIEEWSNANNNRIYRIGQIVIWKENGTFVTFDGDLERNAEATSAVKAHLWSDSLFFVHNIDAFLKSETYLAEVSDVVVRFCNGEYDELSQYGLSDNVRNNADQMALLKENAMKYLQSIIWGNDFERIVTKNFHHSTGVYRFPVNIAAEIAVREVYKFTKDECNSFELIEWVLFDDDTFNVYENEIRKYQ